MAGPEIAIIARDAGPSRIGLLVGAALEQEGCEVHLMLGHGRPLNESRDEIIRTARQSDVLVSGISAEAQLAEPEITAGLAAAAAETPIVYIGDVARCYIRGLPGGVGIFEEGLAEKAVAYMGVSQADADAARGAFPNAKLIGTGNPAREQLALPRFTREEARRQLAAAWNETVIFAPGGKYAHDNIALWRIVQDSAATLMNRGWHPRLVLAVHPGDEAAHASDWSTAWAPEVYREAMKSKVPTQFVDGGIHLLPAADIVTEYGSTLGFGAAYQGIPVVSVDCEPMRNRLYGESRSTGLEIVEAGLSIPADAQNLPELMIGLTDSGFRPENSFTLPEAGTALRAMTETIISFTEQKSSA